MARVVRVSQQLREAQQQVKRVAEAFRTAERDELEAELARRLLVLKESPPSDIRNWESYAIKFLYNKASNWVRDNRASDARHAAFADGEEKSLFPHEAFLASSDSDRDLQIAFAGIWEELDPELRFLWEVLLEEGGNQARVARRLGKHRNTVRLWICRIRQLLKRHGF